MVRQLIKSYSPGLFGIKYMLVVLAYSACVVALANSRKAGNDEGVLRKGIDVVIALDVSKSMLAADVQPNRLERAKHVILKLMEKMPDDRFGLVFFAGRAYMQMPLTSDHAAASMYVNGASPDVVPSQGTIVSEALRTCSLNRFKL